MLLTELNQESFERRLLEIERYFNNKDFVIDENLNFIDKNNFSWKILSLFCPFYALFGLDIYSHVRIDKVMKKVLNYCEANEKFCFGNRFIDWEENLIETLDLKTKRKYTKQLQQIQDEFKKQFSPKSFELDLREGSFLPEIVTQVVDMNLVGTHQKPILLEEKNLQIQETFSNEPTNIHLTSSSFFQKIIEGKINLFLSTQNSIGKGSSRSAYKTYNLSNGKIYIQKKISSKGELLLLKAFLEDKKTLKGKNQEGISEIYELLENEMQILEHSYPYDLDQLRNSDRWEDINLYSRYHLMKNLISGISYLHSIRFTSKNTYSLLQGSSYSWLAFHGDIKPKNIFLEYRTGRWKACLGDFGSFGSIENGTTVYQAPEAIQFRQNLLKIEKEDIPSEDPLNEKKEQLHKLQKTMEISKQRTIANQQGHLSDLWSLALVFIQLFINDLKITWQLPDQTCGLDDQVPRIPKIITYFEMVLNESSSSYRYIPSGHRLPSITQETIDEDLSHFKREISKQYPRETDLTDSIVSIIQKMLKKDPRSRILSA